MSQNLCKNLESLDVASGLVQKATARAESGRANHNEAKQYRQIAESGDSALFELANRFDKAQINSQNLRVSPKEIEEPMMKSPKSRFHNKVHERQSKSL